MPILFVHGNERQHIYGRFKQIQFVARTVVVKTILRQAAGRVAFERRLHSRAAQVGVLGIAVAVVPYEHRVMILCRLVYKSFAKECVEHVFVYPTPHMQIRERAARILVLFGHAE